MFDKLIVSDEQGAEFKGRSRYFMVSTVVVGILFVTALVFSLYAADIGLGNDQFEVSMIVAPVLPEAPEPPRPMQRQDRPQANASGIPIRNTNTLRIEENPKVPSEISVKPNTSLTRPDDGRFKLGIGPETTGIYAPGTGSAPNGVPNGTGSGAGTEPVAAIEKAPDPPPVIKPKVETPKPVVVSIGVVNGKATSLPKPPYPAAALAVRAEGEVSVQVTIDETGKVISAKAVGGHVLLRREAERAAWNARFTPTLLSRVPVKVTGMIVYNFKRS